MYKLYIYTQTHTDKNNLSQVHIKFKQVKSISHTKQKPKRQELDNANGKNQDGV